MGQQSTVIGQQTAISVEGVYKDFKLPHEKVGSVKNIFTNFTHAISASRTYAKQHALKDVSLEIEQGEFFGIVGRNGSGKSTLLKIIAGIYQPTKGKVQVRGKLVPFIELGVGFNPELTGRDNIYLNGALLGFDRKEIDEMYNDIVTFAEQEQFMDQKLKNYSSGMQVRLAFSMAVRAKADILLIDEVLAVGDADFQRKCFNYFNKLRKEKITVVFVSHNMDAIREYCDRAMLIENSKVVEIGSTDSVSEKYLRLFMEDDNHTEELSSTGAQDRWGDQKISIETVRAVSRGGNIYISVSIRANQKFDRPIAGFRIRDAAGSDITGTNTKQEKVTLPNLAKGETKKIEWEMPNVLRDGTYTIDVALQYPDEITVADWWNEAAKLTIKKQRPLPYSVDPGFITIIK